MNATRLSAVKRLSAISVVALLGAATALAPATAGAATWSPGSTHVDSIAGAPWNPSQGVPSFDGESSVTPYPLGDLLPTFSFAGQTTSYTTSGNGLGSTITEPNVAVYPSPTGPTATDETEPFVSGYVGTPGPLSGFCTSSESDATNTNETGSVLSEPSGESLPFSPYYFPQVIQTPGSTSSEDLTGYFDWRPKDGDEAVVSATSTDGGLTWTADGEALAQDQGYCPSADTNDDGNGHPYVATLGSGGSDLYTLQRAMGDTAGTGLLVHSLSAATANSPLSGVPSSESIGVDPNTFAANSSTLSLASSATSIPVSTLGGDAASGNSTTVDGQTIPDPSEIPNAAAKYEVVAPGASQTSSTTPAVISCSGTTGSDGASPTLTGCTAVSGTVSVAPGSDLIEVIGIAQSSKSVNVTYGPQAPDQTSAGAIEVATSHSAYDYGNSVVAPVAAYFANSDSPLRLYVNGSAVYCAGANSTPTYTFEDCTTTNPSGVPVASSTTTTFYVTADPVDPPSTSDSTGVPQTSGLIAPDGIIGAVPSADNSDWNDFDGDGKTVPSGASVVLYTEKLVSYYQLGYYAGTVTATAPTVAQTTLTLPLTTAQNLDLSLNPVESESLPSTGSFDIYLGYSCGTGKCTGNAAAAGIVELTCTSWAPDTTNTSAKVTENGDNEGYLLTGDTIDLDGCTSANGSTDVWGQNDAGGTISPDYWVAGPGANIAPYSALGKIGEGSTSAKKLFGENEDYEAVRAAYTTDGVDFTDLGAISGSAGGAGSTSGAYDDLTDPSQQDSPAGNPSTGGDAANANIAQSNPLGDAPTSLPAGTEDTTELRWPGARGTIVANPDGTLGLFLSGAWGTDGDSDAFNQTFYAESSDGGTTWSVPTVVESTDYDFSASVAQDAALAANGAAGSSPLGVSAYSSGRAYDPTVVQNADGTLTLVFAGYRLPNPVKPAGTPLGTDSSAQYEEGTTPLGSTTFETDPAIYRNILTTTLSQAPSALISEWRPVGPGGASGDDYVDIANTGSSALSLAGWTLNITDGTHVDSVALSGSVPFRGHLLAADSGYDSTLSGVAKPDVDYSLSAAGVGTPVGVQLLNPAGDVVDAVGFTGAPAGYYEGTKLAPPANYPTGQFAWVRNYSGDSLVNSESNASDFNYLSATQVGNPAYGSPTAGVPGPLDLDSPTSVNSFLQVSFVDPNEPTTESPNVVYDGTTGTLDFNYELTNCSGQPSIGVCANAATTAPYTVKALQFRLTSPLTPSTLSAVTSPGGSYTDQFGGSYTTESLSLTPPAVGSGGLNTVLVAALPQGGLTPGSSIGVQFRFDAPTAATRFAYDFDFDTEDDFVPAASSTAAPPAPITLPSGTPILPEVSGTVGPSGVTVVVHPATKTHTKKKAKKHVKKHVKKRAKKHVKKRAKKHTTKHHAG